MIATDGLLGFPKPGLRSSAEGEQGGPAAGRLEEMKIRCRRWEREAGRKEEELWVRSASDSSPGPPTSLRYPLLGGFHFRSFSLRIPMVCALRAGLEWKMQHQWNVVLALRET